jgi:hypothetical protein
MFTSKEKRTARRMARVAAVANPFLAMNVVVRSQQGT